MQILTVQILSVQISTVHISTGNHFDNVRVFVQSIYTRTWQARQLALWYTKKQSRKYSQWLFYFIKGDLPSSVHKWTLLTVCKRRQISLRSVDFERRLSNFLTCSEVTESSLVCTQQRTGKTVATILALFSSQPSQMVIGCNVVQKYCGKFQHCDSEGAPTSQVTGRRQR